MISTLTLRVEEVKRVLYHSRRQPVHEGYREPEGMVIQHVPRSGRYVDQARQAGSLPAGKKDQELLPRTAQQPLLSGQVRGECYYIRQLDLIITNHYRSVVDPQESAGLCLTISICI